MTTRDARFDEPIALTGIGCRFPGGAHGPKAFFQLLLDEVDAISEVPPDRWDWRAYYDPEQGKPGKTYARWGGFLDDIARFDAQAFGISPREAPHIDPQQRLLLEAAWEALEDAGEPIHPSVPSDTGVFVGISTNDYNIIQARTPEVDPYTTPGTVMSIAANRISYCLNLTGPSVALDTACSSSLVAVHSACRALRNRECSVAIAAGVNTLILPYEFVAFSSMTMLSPEGRCRAFDARASGFVRGEGVGAIVLKPLSAALAAGDRIYALVRGTGVNSDGRTNGMTVPSQEAQQALIRQVCREAGVSPRDVRYFEAHGTGTQVGDPIEARALGNALGDDRASDDPCRVGSVKTNIGHLEAGAGIAGIIKVALTLHHDVIPPNLHFVTPNPNIDFPGLKLRVMTKAEPYGDGPKIAGVNSFGFGGTNGHAILEAAPRRERRRMVLVPRADGSPRAELLVASARSRPALAAGASRLAEQLKSLPDAGPDLAELAKTAAVRRGHHEHRVAAVGTSASELAASLAAFSRGMPRTNVVSGQVSGTPRIVFVYGGQGPQWWGMGRQLYRDEPVFRAKLEECHAAMLAAGGYSLLDELLADESRSRMADTAIGQPSIFALQVSLAALWASWGIKPSAVVGHSVGEVAAVHAAGILDLPAAMKVIYHRGRTMSHAPGGRMLAAGITAAEASRLAAAYPGKVFVGAINGPTSVTLSGDGEALEVVRQVLEERGAFVRFLTVPYAFHSAQMDPVREELLESLAGLTPVEARLPILSTVTGARGKGPEFDREYWWKNVRQTVRFAPAIERLAADGFTCFLELAPHPVLAASINECFGDRPKPVVLPSLRRQADEKATMLGSLGALYTLGAELDPRGLWAEADPVPLPGYAWQKERYWNESPASLETRTKPPLHPILNTRARGADPSWEGRLDPRLLPWLPAHAIDGRPVFPGAGYVEAAVAAARQLFGDVPVQLEDVELEKALFLPSGDEQAYLELAARPAESSFVISSRVGEARADWTRHCSGRLRAAGDEPARIDRTQLRARLPDALVIDDFYARFAETGLDFGPAFRTIREAWRRDGEALGRIEVDPKLHGGAFAVHPALFDGCLQVVAAAARPGDPRLQLPVYIDRVRFFRAPASGQFWAQATLLAETRHGMLADVVAFDDEGNVLFEARGFRVRAVSGFGKGSKDDRLHELRWLPKPLPGTRPITGVQVDLQRLARTLEVDARALSDELGHRAKLEALAPVLRRLASAHAERALAAVAGGDAVLRTRLEALVSSAPAETPDATAELASVLPRLPAAEPELLLFGRTARGLEGLLRGEVGLGDVLAPKGALNALESAESGVTRWVAQRTLARAVRGLVEAAPEGRPFRVLELGGGLGGNAARVLPELPADRTTYLFTDTTDVGFERADQKLRDFAFVKYQKLDLFAPDHGLTPASFDLVIAGDALARAPEALLATLRTLLAPGGVLLALEPEVAGPLFAFTGGLGRGVCDRTAWRALLAGAGFSDVEVVSESDAPLDAARVLLLARAPEAVVARTPEVREPGAWLLAGGGETASRLADVLRARGQAVSTTTAATHDALRAALDGAPLRGVVHLHALEAPTNDAGLAALAASEALVCHSALFLTQLLAEGSSTARPQLWLVTRGAQPAGESRETALALAQAPLVGLGRTIINEHPGLKCRLVDLGAEEIDALVDELFSNEVEEEVALRGDARYVERLVHKDDPTGRPARRRVSVTQTPARLEIPSPGALDGLVFRPRARKRPGPGEIEVEVHAAALNFRDVMKTLGIYPGDARDAAVLGDEGAGRVVAVGPGVTRFAVGDAVMSVGGGYFGSHVTIPEAFALKKPARLTFEEAATTLVAYMTAHHALHHLGRMKRGEKVLVHAATGGVGLAAVNLAFAAGAEVFATAGSPEKRAFLKQLGVRHVMDSRTLAFADEVMAATHGRGVDLCLNSLAGEAIEKSLGCLGAGGRFLEIGKRDIYGNTRIGLRPFRNNLSYSAIDLGATMEPGFVGPFLAELAAGLEDGSLPALPHRIFAVGDAVGAFRFMTQARQIGKIVLRVAGESVSLDPTPEERPLALGADATYLVTGGTGGFGLATARWLVESGAKNLVITSRTGEVAEETRRELEKTGVRVRVVRSDIASTTDLEGLLAQIRAELPPLKGVVHSAMVLDDGVLAQLDGDRFHRVMSPKAHGAWNLHDQTKNLDLDFFVLYSSVSSVIGNPGQGNYAAANAALDALAHERHRLGLPALAVNWGLLGEVGVVTRNTKLIDHFQRMGMGALGTREALATLGRLIRAGAPQTTVLKVDWSQWVRSSGTQAGPRYSLLASAGGKEGGPKDDGRALKEAFLAGAEDAKGRVEEFLREQVGKVLRTPATRLTSDLALTELGLDSLMGVELIHRLEAELGVSLPTGKFMAEPTIGRMSKVLTDALAGGKGKAKPQEAPASPVAKAAEAIARNLELEAEVRLDVEIPASDLEAWRVTDPKAVLVTGPREMFGAHLIAELAGVTTAKIYCLVDAADEHAARALLRERLHEVGAEGLPENRLQIVLGDLAKPSLGLNDRQFSALASEVDAIYHNGALFNHVAPYAQLRAVNVAGTVEIIRLAATGPKKPLHYVSGLASLTAHVCRDDSPMREDDPRPATGRLVGGYAESRWVAERIVELAIERGLPATISRPGLLLGDLGSPGLNVDDLSWRAVRACLDVGTVPGGDWDVFLTPVSFARRALVEITRRMVSLGQVFHLVPPEHRRLADLVGPAREAGYRLEELPREEWEVKVLASAAKESENPMRPYIRLLPEEVLASFRSLPGFPAVASTNTQAALADTKITCPPLDPVLVRAFKALADSGLWPTPEEQRARL